MDPEGSLPCSLEPTIEPYPDPHIQSNIFCCFHLSPSCVLHAPPLPSAFIICITIVVLPVKVDGNKSFFVMDSNTVYCSIIFENPMETSEFIKCICKVN
jgi:hypothetical protein